MTDQSRAAERGWSEDRTVWRILSVPDWPGRLRVELAVDTTAVAVVAAIEAAAKHHRIMLERVSPAKQQPPT